MPKFGLLCF